VIRAIHRFAQGLPVQYRWIILACVCLACFSRAGPAVATLSIFVTPMTSEFGWSRTAISGAVSLGGVLAALSSPMLGSYLDRRGPRIVLGMAVLATGITLMLLSRIESLLGFYLFYCVARMSWAGPYDLGIHGAVSNWFVAQRTWAASVAQLAQTTGLIVMPFVGFTLIERHGWRMGWLVIGMAVLAIGFLPVWLFMIRRPEDIGLLPDGAVASPPAIAGENAAVLPSVELEPSYTRAEAMRTPAFWSLALFTVLIFPVQAGMSLHQAAHLIERGLSPASAATAVSLFTLTSAVTGFSYGLLHRWISMKVALAFAGIILAASALVMSTAATLPVALLAGALFGLAMGGIHVILPVAWADYFGRQSFGAIRGVALSFQVVAQAAGPLLSGILRDATGTYFASLMCFAGLSLLGSMAALLTRAPSR
jgi:MFS transporter, OFA family, oxalate/formate antiporter